MQKVKDGGDNDPLKYELSQSVLGEDADGDVVTSCVIVPTGASQGSKGRKSFKLRDDEEIARRCLAELLADPSVTCVTPDLPPSVTLCVRLETWRVTCRDKLTLDDGATGRKQWERLKNKLLRLSIIGVANGFVWLV